MRIEGHWLSEKKQKIAIDSDNGCQRLILLHLRSIDDKCFKVTETFSNDRQFSLYLDDRKVETDMNEDEVKQFEEDWIKFWKPEITKTEKKIKNKFQKGFLHD